MQSKVFKSLNFPGQRKLNFAETPFQNERGLLKDVQLLLKTRPCTTVRDSEDILEQSSFQKDIPHIESF